MIKLIVWGLDIIGAMLIFLSGAGYGYRTVTPDWAFTTALIFGLAIITVSKILLDLEMKSDE